MTIAAILGIAAGLIGVQWLPLPQWRLLGALVFISMLIAGIDALAVLDLPQYAASSNEGKRLVCGLLVGCGSGYFIHWFRRALAEMIQARRKDKANKSEMATPRKSSD